MFNMQKGSVIEMQEKYIQALETIAEQSRLIQNLTSEVYNLKTIMLTLDSNTLVESTISNAEHYETKLNERKGLLEGYNEILTIQEVCAYLRVSQNTLYSQCRRDPEHGGIPSFKSGNLRRIRKAALLEWIDKQGGSNS